MESLTQDGSANRYAGTCSLCRVDVGAGAGVLRAATHGHRLHLVCGHCDSIPTPPVAERLDEFTGDVLIAGRWYARNRYSASCASCGSFVDAGAGVAFKPHPRAKWRALCRECVEGAAREDAFGRLVRKLVS